MDIFSELKEVNGPLYDQLIKIARVAIHKGNDYSNGDPFSAFKGSAILPGIEVEQVFLCLINLKMTRALNLASKPAKYEQLEDTLMDLAVYILLYRAYVDEREGAIVESR